MNFPGGLRCGIFPKDKKENIHAAKGEYLLIEDFLKGFDTNGINKAICFLERQYSFSFGYEAHIQCFSYYPYPLSGQEIIKMFNYRMFHL